MSKRLKSHYSPYDISLISYKLVEGFKTFSNPAEAQLVGFNSIEFDFRRSVCMKNGHGLLVLYVCMCLCMTMYFQKILIKRGKN